MIEKILYGKVGPDEVYLFKMDNGRGLTAEIITYGGIVRTLCYNGVDVVLGRDTLEEYMENNGCYGALIGRNSNRIAKGEFTLNGKKYTLAKNNGNNNLHGGNIGFGKRVWQGKAVDKEEPSLILSIISEDGDEGFPGKVKVKVTYTLTKDNGLKIHYEGKANADTLLNMTNHTYFNLNGHDSGTVDGHTLMINSSFYTPNTDECMPYGVVESVAETAFDFRKGIKMADGFTSGHPQVELFGGYDHNFALDGFGFRKFSTLTGDVTGIVMDSYTDRPAVQLYTGNGIQTERVCKGGAKYPVHGGLCLETQVFPNAMEYSHFPSPVLKKGEVYDTVTEYRFHK
ncbi:MAG: aldose epimerase family protein [Clostridia bacterium]|nr:aldose epimerase family protein [Clostridia bacterium]